MAGFMFCGGPSTLLVLPDFDGVFVMQITPPYGYRDVTPLLKTHRVKWTPGRTLPEFALTTNALPVTMSEVPVAGHDYPIVFTSSDNKTRYSMVAVLGLTASENLYNEDGVWASGQYLPAYVRRYPFCMTRVNIGSVEQSQRIVCVESEQLTESGGTALFDVGGNPLADWTQTERLLNEFEADLDRSREMCAIINDLKLLEPFTAQATFDAGGSFQLDGMFRVEEKRLESLTADDLRMLMRKGILSRIYQHLASLTNFNRLTERKGRLLKPAQSASDSDTSATPAVST